MRNNRRNSNVHMLLFILLCIALAVLASAATFRRGRPAKSWNSGTTPPATSILSSNARSDGSSEKSFRGGRSL